MSAESTSPESDAATQQPDEETHPKGTLLITAVFLVVMALAWAGMYLTMLSRS